MSVEQNRASVLRFYEEAWNRGNVDVIDDIFAPVYVRHEGKEHQTLEAGTQKQIAAAVRQAITGLSLDVELTVTEGDLVAGYWRISGMDAASGKPITDYTGVNIFRFTDGRVTEIWNVRDDLGRLRQSGLIPDTGMLMQQKGEDLDIV